MIIIERLPRATESYRELPRATESYREATERLPRGYREATERLFDIYITYVMSIKDTRYFKKMKRII
jgi:hypothetical protein